MKSNFYLWLKFALASVICFSSFMSFDDDENVPDPFCPEIIKLDVPPILEQGGKTSITIGLSDVTASVNLKLLVLNNDGTYTELEENDLIPDQFNEVEKTYSNIELTGYKIVVTPSQENCPPFEELIFPTCLKYELSASFNDSYGRYVDGHVFYFPKLPIINSQTCETTASSKITRFGLEEGDELFLCIDGDEAKITGTVTIYSGENIGTQWGVNIELIPTDRANCDPKFEFKSSANTKLTEFEKFWEYYKIKLDGDSFLELIDTPIQIHITSEIAPYCMQIGLGGNNKNLGFGLSDWFKWKLVKEGEGSNGEPFFETIFQTNSHADINVDLECSSQCPDIGVLSPDIDCEEDGFGTVVLNLNNVIPEIDQLDFSAAIDGVPGVISDVKSLLEITPMTTNILDDEATVQQIGGANSNPQIEVRLPIGQYTFKLQRGDDPECISEVNVRVASDKFNVSPAKIPAFVNCNFDDGHVFWFQDFCDLANPSQKGKTIFSLMGNDQLYLCDEDDCLYLQGTVTVKSGKNVNTNWEVNIKFNPKDDVTEGKFECGLIPGNLQDFFENHVWKYYTIDEDLSYLQYTENADIYRLEFLNKSNYTQLGVAANGKNYKYGLSTWFDWVLKKNEEETVCQGSKHADINIDLECRTECALQLAALSPEVNCDSDGFGTVVLNLNNVIAGLDQIDINAIVEGEGLLTELTDLIPNITPTNLSLNYSGTLARIQSTSTINPQIELKLPIGQYTFTLQREGQDDCTSQVSVLVTNDKFKVEAAVKSVNCPFVDNHVFWLRGFCDLTNLSEKGLTTFSLDPYNEDELYLCEEDDFLYLRGTVTVQNGKNIGTNWDVNVKFKQPSEPNCEGKFECGLVPDQLKDFFETKVWQYYEIDEEKSYLRYSDGYDMYKLRFMNINGSDNCTQIGIAANGKNYKNGLSTWFNWVLEKKSYSGYQEVCRSTKHGDINIDLICTDEVPDIVIGDDCDEMYPMCGDNFYSYDLNRCIAMKPEKMTNMYDKISPMLENEVENTDIRPMPGHAIFRCYMDAEEEGELGAECLAMVEFCGQYWKLSTQNMVKYNDEGKKMFVGDGKMVLLSDENIVCELPYVKLRTIGSLETPEGRVYQALRMGFKWEMEGKKGWNNIVFPLSKVCTKSIDVKFMECSRKRNKYQTSITNIDPFFPMFLMKDNGKRFKVEPGQTRNLFSKEQEVICFVDGEEEIMEHEYEYGNQRCSSTDYTQTVMNEEDDIDWDEGEPVAYANTSNYSLPSFGIKAYPNPTTGSFTLEAYGNDSRIEIFTPSGNKVYELSFNTTFKREVNVSEFGRGIFIIRLISDGEQVVEKVVVN
ncbi:T9SS type A sorting domain-containing protein [Sediminitomix flava]|nr:T9SS type A sorting domain-containing protein [Sediminitomix flava]